MVTWGDVKADPSEIRGDDWTKNAEANAGGSRRRFHLINLLRSKLFKWHIAVCRLQFAYYNVWTSVVFKREIWIDFVGHF